MNLRPLHPLLLAVALLAACGTQVVNPVTGRTELSVMDEATEIKEGAKEVGHDLKEGAKELGHDIKEGAKAVAHDVKEAAVEAKDAAKDATKKD